MADASHGVGRNQADNQSNNQRRDSLSDRFPRPDAPTVAQMEEDDDLRQMIQLGQDGRQDLSNRREFSRRRPVTHEAVARNLERVSSIDEKTDVKKIQKNTPSIKTMYGYVSKNQYPDAKNVIDDELRGFLKFKNKFEIRNGVLMRKIGEGLAIVLPSAMIGQLFRQFHVDGGHMSAERTYQNITRKYYAYGLLAALHTYTSKCETCLLYDKRGVGNSPASFIKADAVGHKVFLDAIGKLALESEEQCSYCLLAIDCYSRYVVGKQLRNLDGESVVRAIQQMYIFKHGFFRCLITDNGLDSVQLREFCKTNSIDLTFLSVYSPMGNLQEKCNHSVKRILYKLCNDDRKQWNETTFAQTLHLYNISQHKTVGYAPFYLFYGRAPLIPLDLYLNSTEVDQKTQIDHLDDLRDAISRVTDNAYDAFSKSQNLCARRQNLRNADYFAGQRVLVRNFRKKNKFDVNFLKNFEIVKRLGKSCYLCKNLTTNRFSKCNIRDIKNDTNNVLNADTPEELETEQKYLEQNGLAEQNGVEKEVEFQNSDSEENGIEQQQQQQSQELGWEDQMRQNQEVRTRAGRLTRQPDRFGQTKMD